MRNDRQIRYYSRPSLPPGCSQGRRYGIHRAWSWKIRWSGSCFMRWLGTKHPHPQSKPGCTVWDSSLLFLRPSLAGSCCPPNRNHNESPRKGSGQVDCRLLGLEHEMLHKFGEALNGTKPSKKLTGDETLKIRKSGMGTYTNPFLLRLFHGMLHYHWITCVETTCHVGGTDTVHYSTVVSYGINSETFSKVAVQINFQLDPP